MLRESLKKAQNDNCFDSNLILYLLDYSPKKASNNKPFNSLINDSIQFNFVDFYLNLQNQPEKLFTFKEVQDIIYTVLIRQ